jgi:hypothetical protein
MCEWEYIDTQQQLTLDEELTLYRVARMFLSCFVTFEHRKHDYHFPEPMPDDDQIAIGDATLEALEEKGFITQETVMRRKYWGLTEKGKAAVHDNIEPFDTYPNESITHRAGVAIANLYLPNVSMGYDTNWSLTYRSIDSYDSTTTFDVIGCAKEPDDPRVPWSEANIEPRVRVAVITEADTESSIMEDFEVLRDVGYHNSPHYSGAGFWLFPRRSTAYDVINYLVEQDQISLRNGTINKNTPLKRAQREVAECYNPGFDAFGTYSKLMPWEFEYPGSHAAPIGDRAVLDNLRASTAYDYVDEEIYASVAGQRTD